MTAPDAVLRAMEDEPGPLPEAVAAAWDGETQDAEINRLRSWLSEIADRHLGDQPAALNIPEADWAKRHIMTLRRMARDGLAGKDAADAE